MTDAQLQSIAEKLGVILSQKGLLLALAESCTGGWLGQTATAVSGSSSFFDRGFVTYSNQAKTEMLGVSAQVIRSEGAVSRAVVEQMASGALARSAADCAIAVSGVAGPNGGTAQRPVGTVWLAWAGPEFGVQAQCFNFKGNREAVRRASVAAGLQGLLDRLA